INATTGAVVTYETKGRKNAVNQSSGSGTSTGSTYIGEPAAKESALTHAGVAESSTTDVECYLEYEDGKPVCYCVEFKVSKAKYEYEIDLYSGAVLNYAVESYDSSSSGKDSAEASASTSYIGESAALAAALKHAGVAETSLTEKHVELDRDGNTMIYQVEFETRGQEYEYEIDAASGTVLKAENH
ncbi:MAG: PepSY domain-containing protein, partial [Clostridiales bacterium]|nr:PepSY domain-containing protein [Clostridiales bacterium]